ncbi:nucleoporin Nsp1 [Schizosaccharomyces cryophilus OY26]|uniref:Nucleoporin NSP1 n=1 Tax=Schizosaccharomyces cryophilus (strain OY26 / ATCC MYA-4695 / CBS 11777 / NBRC 106824 / NRRL Y48691) TaxID=653667 RepID=S9W0V7_SCHCR|nr:nucleoporin Nsp1 [Schizosaccharomyces cryophilus OY26]EPY52064.1 nucleoporin Nsp1 [Schizosaccharomyces cryophilus OY26]
MAFNPGNNQGTGFSFGSSAPNNTSNQGAGASSNTNLFGGNSGNTGGLFGSASNTAKPGGGFGFGSNASDSGNKPSFSFGQSNPSGNAPLFGGLNKPAAEAPTGPTASANTNQPTTQPSGTSGFSFGAKPAAPTTSASSTGGGITFGGGLGSGGGLFGQKPATNAAAIPSTAPAQDKPAAGGFSFGKAAGSASENKPSPATTGGFSFGGGGTSTNAAATPSTAPTQDKPAAGGFNFGKAAESSSDNKPSPAPTGGFSFGGGGTSTAGAAKPAESKPLFSFGGGAGSGNKLGTTTTTPASTEANKPSTDTTKPSTTAPAQPSSGFSFGKQDSTTKPTTTTTTGSLFGSKPAESNVTKPDATKDTASKSTATVPVESPPSSIKHKTLQEILNKWSSDLTTQTTVFNKLCDQVADWDKALIDNGALISKLYAETVDAEQLSNRVDDGLEYVSSSQQELFKLLDSYEAQLESFDGRTPTAPNVERERAFNVADDILSRLDRLGEDLGTVINQMNDFSKPDDSISEIVKVLNAQVASLGWVENRIFQMEEKIESVKKRSNDVLF